MQGSTATLPWLGPCLSSRRTSIVFIALIKAARTNIPGRPCFQSAQPGDHSILTPVSLMISAHIGSSRFTTSTISSEVPGVRSTPRSLSCVLTSGS